MNKLHRMLRALLMVALVVLVSVLVVMVTVGILAYMGNGLSVALLLLIIWMTT